MATAISNVVRISSGMIEYKVLFEFVREKFLKSLISKWPATIFAVSRTERVIGRIRFLTISIITMKFISGVGVPTGTMWIIIFFELLVHPKIIIRLHIHTANENVIEIWAVLVKINGNKAKKLIIRIAKNIALINKRVPFFWFVEMRVFTSVLIALKMEFINVEIFNFDVILNTNKKITGKEKLAQAKLKDDWEGSKIENKLFIIFNLTY